MIFTVFYKIIVIWIPDKNKLDILFQYIVIILNLYHLLSEQYFSYMSKHKKCVLFTVINIKMFTELKRSGQFRLSLLLDC